MSLKLNPKHMQLPKTNVMKSEKGRILFVEDDHMLVDMFHEYFELHGYDFLSSKEIPEALDLTRFEQPDVVLLDIIIPKEKEDGTLDLMAAQGYDYLEAVKKDPKTKDIPIIVFTNLDTSEDRAKAEKMGAYCYIFKNNTEPKEVREVIDRAIGERKAK